MKEIKPVSPVIPNSVNGAEVKVAENQPEYRTLPSLAIDDNTFLTRWKVPFLHRLRILFSGNIFIEIMHFRKPIQPLYVDTKPNTVQVAGD